MAEMVKQTLNLEEETNKELDQELEQNFDGKIEENDNLTPSKRGRKKKIDIQEADEDDEIEKLRAENESIRKQNESIKKQLDEVLKNLALMQNQKNDNFENKNDSYDSVLVGCHSYTPTTLRTSDNRICITFNGREKKLIDVDDLKDLLKSSSIQDNRSLFEKGIFYFAKEDNEDGYYNEENYVRFKVKKRIDLSKEGIKKIIFIQNPNDMILEIRRISNNLIDRGVLHILKYSIVDMYVNAPAELNGWSFENKQELEKILNTNIDILMRNLGVFKFLNDRR